MPRPQRIEFAGAVYHVMNRGFDHQPVFKVPGDAERFLEILAATTADNGWRCLGYCLLTNHYHLVIRTDQPTLSHGMQRFAARYTEAFNRRHGRGGALFRGRFKAILVEPEQYLVALMRYVMLSPMLAGLAADPSAWRWSSFRATAGLAEAPAFLDIGWLIGPYGAALPEACAAWRADIADSYRYKAMLGAWDEALRRRSILGSPEFASRHKMRIKPLSPASQLLLRGQTP